MKELSIKQKAEAYDEAFRIALELYNDPNSSKVGKGYVCTIFPELQESEDEKIRKELIKFVKVNIPDEERYIAWLEKQGGHDFVEEPNFFDDFRNSEEVDSNEDGLIAETIKYKNEKQGEQKPADKIEPKFKVGDIIIKSQNSDINKFGKFKITDINEKWGAIKTPSTKLSHLGLPESQFEFHPATKEQRELLFAKMKEAGYEWNTEKKELKKQDIVEIPFGTDSELQEAFYRIPKGFHAEIDGNKVVIKKGNQKPIEWSEEDEEMLVSIISDFAAAHKSSISQDKWLKSLKEKIK